MWDSKYLVSIFPRRHCDHQFHNGNPDEEHMQLLSLNKISQFPLHSGTMGLLPGCWLSSYSWGPIIASKPLPSHRPHSFYPTAFLHLHQPLLSSFPCLGLLFVTSCIIYHISFHSVFTFLPPFLFIPPSFISPLATIQGESVRDHVSLAVIDQINKWLFYTVTPCEAHLHQSVPGSRRDQVCQRTLLNMIDFWVDLL